MQKNLAVEAFRSGVLVPAYGWYRPRYLHRVAHCCWLAFSFSVRI